MMTRMSRIAIWTTTSPKEVATTTTTMVVEAAAEAAGKIKDGRRGMKAQEVGRAARGTAFGIQPTITTTKIIKEVTDMKVIAHSELSAVEETGGKVDPPKQPQL